MLTCDYIVERIDGDYALLQRVDMPEEELKTVASRSSSTRDRGRFKIAL